MLNRRGGGGVRFQVGPGCCRKLRDLNIAHDNAGSLLLSEFPHWNVVEPLWISVDREYKHLISLIYVCLHIRITVFWLLQPHSKFWIRSSDSEQLSMFVGLFGYSESLASHVDFSLRNILVFSSHTPPLSTFSYSGIFFLFFICETALQTALRRWN